MVAHNRTYGWHRQEPMRLSLARSDTAIAAMKSYMKLKIAIKYQGNTMSM
ncbi:MAG: hypothetical protein Q8L88_01620 [Bacteroidota bacterium]|nr:hypothetical protein [Bacteroidota bacterium]